MTLAVALAREWGVYQPRAVKSAPLEMTTTLGKSSLTLPPPRYDVRLLNVTLVPPPRLLAALCYTRGRRQMMTGAGGASSAMRALLFHGLCTNIEAN